MLLRQFCRHFDDDSSLKTFRRNNMPKFRNNLDFGGGGGQKKIQWSVSNFGFEMFLFEKSWLIISKLLLILFPVQTISTLNHSWKKYMITASRAFRNMYYSKKKIYLKGELILNCRIKLELIANWKKGAGFPPP